MKTRRSRSVILRIGNRYQWRILSRWDDSVLASGYALRWEDCKAAAQEARSRINEEFPDQG